MIDREIFEKLKNDMSAHFITEYPREACGIITNNWSYIPCKNISTTPKDTFVLDPVSLLEYENTAWGVVHSHPGSDNPIPSEEDMASAVFDCYKFIVGFNNRFYIYWFNKKSNTLMYEELEERHFE